MGKLIEFGKPGTRPTGDWAPVAAPDAPVCAPHVSPAAILAEVVGHQDHLSELLILTRDKSGNVSILGNLGGPGESALFMMNILQKMASVVDTTNDPPPPRRA